MFYGYETCVYSLKISWPPYTHLTLHICNKTIWKSARHFVIWFPSIWRYYVLLTDRFHPLSQKPWSSWITIISLKIISSNPFYESVKYSTNMFSKDNFVICLYNTKYYAMISCCTMTLTNWCWWNRIYKHIKEYSLYRKEKYLSISGLTLAEQIHLANEIWFRKFILCLFPFE